MKTKKDTTLAIGEKVTTRMITLLEEGTVPWKRPWSVGGGDLSPRNPVTGTVYRGRNWLLLSLMGWDSPYFVTYNQARCAGGSVVKGSKGNPIIKASSVTKEDANGDKHDHFYVKGFTVFNSTQVEGMEFPELNIERHETNDIEVCEKIIKGWKDCPPITIAGAKAFYMPSSHSITMPERDRFKSDNEWYSTIFHEMIHATSQPLERKLGNSFGTASYGEEELIAELGSAILCTVAGIDKHVEDHNASYLQSWINVLKGSPEMIMTASKAAIKACEHILNKPITA